MPLFKAVPRVAVRLLPPRFKLFATKVGKMSMRNYVFTGDYAEDCKEHQVLNGRLVHLQTTMESGFKNVENGFKNPETQVKDVQTGVARIDSWILLLVGAVSDVLLHPKRHPQSN